MAIFSFIDENGRKSYEEEQEEVVVEEGMSMSF